MKRPVKKVKRFSEGGFSEEQEKWLGGADRTDPLILARMRKAVPDEVKKAAPEPKAEPEETKSEPFESGFTPTEGIKDKAESKPAPKPAPNPAPKPASKPEPKVNNKTFSETIAPATSKEPRAGAKPVPKTEDKENVKDSAKAYQKAAEMNQPFESNFPKQKSEPSGKAKAQKSKLVKSNRPSYKAGGSVKSSASKRGDGIATKGRTRGKIC